MSSIDGPIWPVSEINMAHSANVNISEAQPSKARGRRGVGAQRTTSQKLVDSGPITHTRVSRAFK